MIRMMMRREDLPFESDEGWDARQQRIAGDLDELVSSAITLLDATQDEFEDPMENRGAERDAAKQMLQTARLLQVDDALRFAGIYQAMTKMSSGELRSFAHLIVVLRAGFVKSFALGSVEEWSDRR